MSSADISAQRMNAKIRQAQFMKVPYMLVVGENEMNAEQVSLRVRDGKPAEQHPAGRSSSSGPRIGLPSAPEL